MPATVEKLLMVLISKVEENTAEVSKLVNLIEGANKRAVEQAGQADMVMNNLVNKFTGLLDPGTNARKE